MPLPTILAVALKSPIKKPRSFRTPCSLENSPVSLENYALLTENEQHFGPKINLSADLDHFFGLNLLTKDTGEVLDTTYVQPLDARQRLRMHQRPGGSKIFASEQVPTQAGRGGPRAKPLSLVVGLLWPQGGCC